MALLDIYALCHAHKMGNPDDAVITSNLAALTAVAGGWSSSRVREGDVQTARI